MKATVENTTNKVLDLHAFLRTLVKIHAVEALLFVINELDAYPNDFEPLQGKTLTQIIDEQGSRFSQEDGLDEAYFVPKDEYVPFENLQAFKNAVEDVQITLYAKTLTTEAEIDAKEKDVALQYARDLELYKDDPEHLEHTHDCKRFADEVLGMARIMLKVTKVS